MSKFALSEEQIKVFEILRKQQKEKDSHMATIGGRWTFSFTPTGLGTVVEVKDNKTGDILDLTDINEW